jgi:hypothetical protein
MTEEENLDNESRMTALEKRVEALEALVNASLRQAPQPKLSERLAALGKGDKV